MISIMKETFYLFSRYAAINSLALEVHEEECLDHTYESMIKELRATSWENNTNIGGAVMLLFT